MNKSKAVSDEFAVLSTEQKYKCLKNILIDWYSEQGDEK